ncbi:hypothetical protein NDU88_004670 [Pleurodeles waltl]|uniref:Secreted protein n=1 Tax=Pleurodeles waltl TaxID=8319 RepID=A0AAV7PFP0_PLEWA|nr:hypothetical protein NDU88_004670 [Pleurodeles waltl]
MWPGSPPVLISAVLTRSTAGPPPALTQSTGSGKDVLWNGQGKALSSPGPTRRTAGPRHTQQPFPRRDVPVTPTFGVCSQLDPKRSPPGP